MKNFRFLMLALISTLSLLSFTSGHAVKQSMHEQQKTEPSFYKVYVSPNRVLLRPEGVFYLNESGELASARLVASDASGLYILAVAYSCPCCGMRNRDNVCFNKRCPLYDK